MTQDQEWLVRLQFLEEAQEYLNTVESELLGLGSGGIGRAGLDNILRAAHSIKGGAALMGFSEISHLAHRLEDFFKVLRSGQKADIVDASVEQLFLAAVDSMRQMTVFYRQKRPVTDDWLESHAQPFIEQLHAQLGDPLPEDEIAELSAEAGEDMVALLFESEVGPCLERLERVLNTPEMPLLREEMVIACQEMGGLGEMLELAAFVSLCQHIVETVDQTSDGALQAIATQAIQTLRRSQALVLLGQTDFLPSQLELSTLPSFTELTPIENEEELDSENDGDSETEREIENEIDKDEDDTEVFAPLSTLLNVDPSQIAGLAASLSLPPLSEFPQPLDEGDESVWAIESEPVLELAFANDPSEPEFPDDLDEEDHSDPTLITIGEPQNTPTAEAQGLRLSRDDLSLPAPPQTLPSVVPAQEPTSASETSEDSTIRVSVQQLERLGELFGELTTERNGLNLQLRYLKNLVTLLSRRVKALNQANDQLRVSYDRASTAQPVAASIPLAAPMMDLSGRQEDLDLLGLGKTFDVLEMDRYSDLHLVAQEIIERVVQIQEVSNDIELALDDTEGVSRELSRTAQQMQIGITQVRMRPLSEITRRFPRLLRQLSMEHGKSVELKVKGGGTLIERSILEALQDPLMHLLRNCFDHGIEPTETRLAQGKPLQGTIEISASYRGNQTVITVRDDGGGINLDKIRAKVLTMGLTPAEVEACTKQELLDLIFEPGFSTADRVTDLSGRGVGMDVVRSNLQGIRGTIQVDTEAGQGSVFTLTVPLSLSVTRVLVVECQGIFLAFPANIVEEMELLHPSQVMVAADQELIEWQGYTVPLLRLDQWLRFSRPPIKLETESIPTIDQEAMLLVTQGEEPYAIHCDRYWGEQEVTTRMVEGNIALPAGFSGCVVLGDGRVVPLVDIEALLDWILSDSAEPRAGESSLELLQPQKFEEKPTILIIDDSINVRRFLAITLEKAGYRVEQAKDGQDALEKLQEISPGSQGIDAIISDVEMPRVDGFRFLAQVKGIPDSKDIPVVMLTSRSGDKHRQLALHLGASGYFSKPFKQNELLQALEDLTQSRQPSAAVSNASAASASFRSGLLKV